MKIYIDVKGDGVLGLKYVILSGIKWIYVLRKSNFPRQYYFQFKANSVVINKKLSMAILTVTLFMKGTLGFHINSDSEPNFLKAPALLSTTKCSVFTDYVSDPVPLTSYYQ